MKFLLACISLVITAFLFSSCQREVDGQLGNGTINGVNTNDSIYLVKYIELDTTYASGSDTIQTGQFYYDGTKRLLHSAVRGDGIDPLQATSAEDEYRFYSGSDTLPYKIVLISYDPSSGHSADTSFLFYNSNLIIV